MLVRDLPLLLDLTICKQVTLEGPWVRELPTMRGNSFFLFFLVLTSCVSFGLSLAFLFCLPLLVLAIDILLDLCDFIRST